MKKYAFPPGVATMTPEAYRDHCTAEAAKERAAKDARKQGLADRRAERERAKAARASRRAEVLASSPRGKLATLEVGQSYTYPDYSKTTQVSKMLASYYVDTGCKFTSAIQRDMVTGESVIGVTVTRVS